MQHQNVAPVIDVLERGGDRGKRLFDARVDVAFEVVCNMVRRDVQRAVKLVAGEFGAQVGMLRLQRGRSLCLRQRQSERP
jgi:hypothetical protein